MKKAGTYVLVFTLCWLFFAGTILRQEHLAGQVIRLHILANSDSEADQAEKLRVRDALLPQLTALTEGCTTREAAARALAAGQSELGQTAARISGRSVTVSLMPEWYGTRHYGDFSLPAGRYLSLCVKIGAAEGRNWWCVAFPSVCSAATAEGFETTAVSAGLDERDLRMMTVEEPDVEVRFFVLELLEKLHRLLAG